MGLDGSAGIPCVSEKVLKQVPYSFPRKQPGDLGGRSRIKVSLNILLGALPITVSSDEILEHEDATRETEYTCNEFVKAGPEKLFTLKHLA